MSRREKEGQSAPQPQGENGGFAFFERGMD